MSFELSSGSLYIRGINGESELFVDDVYGIAELQTSATEALSMYYNLKSSASLSYEIKHFDLDLLDKICNNSVPTGHFVLQYQRPIMIQARWHKKPRIRKKWLKRYGMKPDVVEVKMDATALEYHPGHILDEQCYDRGICATFDSLGFETHNQEYVLRPDQKRRGIKIEWQKQEIFHCLWHYKKKTSEQNKVITQQIIKPLQIT